FLLGQHPFGEVHPLVQIVDLGAQLLQLRQHGVVDRGLTGLRDLTTDTLGERANKRAQHGKQPREEHDPDDGFFYAHPAFPGPTRCGSRGLASMRSAKSRRSCTSSSWARSSLTSSRSSVTSTPPPPGAYAAATFASSSLCS